MNTFSLHLSLLVCFGRHSAPWASGKRSSSRAWTVPPALVQMDTAMLSWRRSREELFDIFVMFTSMWSSIFVLWRRRTHLASFLIAALLPNDIGDRVRKMSTVMALFRFRKECEEDMNGHTFLEDLERSHLASVTMAALLLNDLATPEGWSCSPRQWPLDLWLQQLGQEGSLFSHDAAHSSVQEPSVSCSCPSIASRFQEHRVLSAVAAIFLSVETTGRLHVLPGPDSCVDSTVMLRNILIYYTRSLFSTFRTVFGLPPVLSSQRFRHA